MGREPRHRQNVCTGCSGELELHPLIQHGGMSITTCLECRRVAVVEPPAAVTFSTPPWIKLIRETHARQLWCWWTASAERCGACGTYGLAEGRLKRLGLAPQAIPTLCLICGSVTVTPSSRAPGDHPGRLLGSAWEPIPDPAVAALRDLVWGYSPLDWRPDGSDDDGE
jgi:hypothetical protein